MNNYLKHGIAAALLFSTSLTFAADIDGSWNCTEEFTEGPMRIHSTQTQHYDSNNQQTHSEGQVEIYEQNQLSYQFAIKIDGSFSLSGSQLTERANAVDVQLTNQPRDLQLGQAMQQELMQALKEAQTYEVLKIDQQQLQVKDPETGEISSCNRLSSAV